MASSSRQNESGKASGIRFKQKKREVSPPINFAGRLADGEEWMDCIYDKSHKYLNTRWDTHLPNCRNQYKKLQEKEKKPVEIVICRYNYQHHVHISQIADHERNCDFRSDGYGFVVQYYRDMRVREMQRKAKEEKQKKGARAD